MVNSTTPSDGPYALHAYIQHGHVIRVGVFGRTSFKRIFQNRPNAARYAVAGYYRPAVDGDRFVVWDMYDVRLVPPGNDVVEPKFRLQHDDLDAAIMATLMLYDTGG